MSLAKQIAARMLAKKSTAAAAAPRVVSAPAPIEASKAYNPPKAPAASRGERIAAGHARRNAPEPAITADLERSTHPGKFSMHDAELVEPVRTSALPAEPSGPRTITERPPPLPPMPARRELDVDLVKGLEALPLPAPAEPERLARNLTTGFRGSCKAISADTGQQCALLAGHTTSHRHGSTAFFRVATPNQKSFTRRDLIDAAGSTRNSPEAS